MNNNQYFLGSLFKIFSILIIFCFNRGFSTNLVFGFGDNSRGELNLDLIDLQQTLPIQLNFTFPGEVVDIATGNKHSLVLTSNGEVYSFGDNSYGQLCRNLSANLTYTNETGLINMTSLSGTIVKIGGSSFASYFLMNDGSVYSCGFSDYALQSTNVSYPQKISLLNNIVDIQTGFIINLAIAKNGSLFSWGDSNILSNCFLSSYTLSFASTLFGIIPMQNPVYKAKPGFYNAIILDCNEEQNKSFFSSYLKKIAQNQLFVCGNNGSGNLGYYALPNRIPTSYFNGETIVDISSSYFINFVVTDAGKIYSFGSPASFSLSRPGDPLSPLLIPLNDFINQTYGSVFIDYFLSSQSVLYSLGFGSSQGRTQCNANFPYIIPTSLEYKISKVSSCYQHALILADAPQNSTPSYSDQSCQTTTSFMLLPVTTEMGISSNLFNASSIASSNHSASNVLGIILGVVLSILFFVVIGILALFFLLRKKGYLRKPSPQTPDVTLSMSKCKIISEIQPSAITIEYLIGEGNFASVYKGFWNGAPVALKKLKDSKLIESFLSEIDILNRVSSHPNVLRLLGIYTDDQGAKYIVTDFISRGSLNKFLQSYSKPLSQAQKIHIACQIAAGMICLEDAKIIHRDLSARNILVAEEDGDFIPKISDFGLSRVIENEYNSQGGEFPIRWTAPEAILYRKFTHKSDVWSFGIVMWEIWTQGQHPYAEFSNVEVKEKVVQGIRLFQPNNCPIQVYELMMKCWNSEANSRPSFLDLFNALNSILIPFRKQPSVIPRRDNLSMGDSGIVYNSRESLTPSKNNSREEVSPDGFYLVDDLKKSQE